MAHGHSDDVQRGLDPASEGSGGRGKKALLRGDDTGFIEPGDFLRQERLRLPSAAEDRCLRPTINGSHWPTELRQHVTHLAEEIGERNVLRRPKQLAQAADWIEGRLAKWTMLRTVPTGLNESTATQG
jgi:hypothetical protein